MSKTRTNTPEEFSRPLRRVLVALLVLVLFAVFLLWRIDSPRVERFRAAPWRIVLQKALVPVAAGMILTQEPRGVGHVVQVG